jgi:hypothetical protein
VPEYQCAAASLERDEPIFATASQVHRWLLVEVRGAWGRDVVADTHLADHVPAGWADKLKAHGVRPIAIRRDLQLDRVDGEVNLFFVEASRGQTRPGSIWSTVVTSLADVVDATAEIGEHVLPAGPPGWQRVDTNLVLVCTNGRHDSCCATFGRPLVRHLRKSPAAPSVWECSHVGGDRFAANVVMLPDSIYFGRVTVDRVDALLDGFAESQLDLDLYRGRSTLSYAAQAAEYFTRRELSLTAVDAVPDVRRLAPDRFELDVAARVTDGDSSRSGPSTIEVVIERTRVPAPSPLTCTGPADVSYPAYRLVSLEMWRREP